MSRVSGLEKQARRRLIHFTFESSVKTGRWFASSFSCCLGHKEHKFLRFAISLTSNGSKKLPGIRYHKSTIAGVPCRIYRSVEQKSTPVTGIDLKQKTQAKLPVIVYIHGGGWTVCSARSYHMFASILCRDTGSIVVSVDYGLAPEKTYPHGYEDCLAVVRCILNADTLMPSPFIAGRVDTSHILVAGDSAGGNLAASVALDLIRNNDHRIRGLVLICPAMQGVNFSLPSYKKYAPEFALDWFIAQYAGVRPTKAVLEAMRQGDHLGPEGRRLRQKYVPDPELPKENTEKLPAKCIPSTLSSLCEKVPAWPLLAADEHLAQLPPTFLQSAEFDPLLDENEIFADRLKKAGTRNFEYKMLPNAEHVEPIFVDLLNSQASINGLKQITDFIINLFSSTDF